MNENKTPNDETEAEIAEASAAADASVSADAGDEAAKALEQLSGENAELKDRMLRLAAEMDNLRKRTEREVADTRAYAIASFARDMLTATDSLSRALMVISPETRASADATLKSLIEGIDMTEREMQRLLAKHGVKPIEAEGQKFDPHRHQAMFEVPDATKPEGTVVQVVQTGFAIGERVLRPAMVGVSRGGGAGGSGEADTAGVDKSA
ncbi:molecular chaperone GrpE [Devosia enhydra]|uniref:Protein GrpE n=1 Tax=Devosia enhydra TaxID=665118 RepID=A0A1K2HYI2_9HYPH|nr:nucleotide exchange factor GrpE [Devosia enhydra]SFZ84939.1 molecular chaperone GrpE [Devosia enhydra]